MQQIIKSISVALQNIKANPLHSTLSMLGVIIGVASLVAILALGDGLEKTGREQIETTTSVQMMRVAPKTVDVLNNVRVPRDTVYEFSIEDARTLEQATSEWGITELMAQSSRMATFRDSSIAIYIQATLENAIDFSDAEITGKYFSHNDIEQASMKTVLTESLALKWTTDPKKLIGQQVKIEGNSFEVIGIIESTEQNIELALPISTYKKHIKNSNTPVMMFKAEQVEDLPKMKEKVTSWLNKNFEEGEEAFSVFTYEGRVEQLSQGILIFKLVMGAITGISVLVGGIGIMNVLLISVTERTKEIGIRKAAGARKKDIISQFISESVAISLVGSLMGWVVGVLGVFGIVELINRFTDLTFQAALSLGTAFIVLIVAIGIGIIFGTYPAWKAANLTPVDAIRHE